MVDETRQGAETWDGLPVDAPRVIGGRYELRVLIGTGGFGEVWEAYDRITARVVAVKLLFALSTEAVHRFRREVAALRALRLPGVVRFVDEGRHQGRYYLVMQRIHGEDFPGRRPPGSPGVAWRWEDLAPRIARLLEILGRVHAAGVVHRDVKPSNVKADDAGNVWVLDFGIARGHSLGSTITRVDQPMGTPRYFAPEQSMGLRVDARADLYAVGVMAWEALTGEPMQTAHSMTSLIETRRTRDVEPILRRVPDLPVDVAATIDRLLRRNPDERPGSAAEVLALLKLGSGPSTLRWLGDTGVVDALVAAALEGRSASVDGPRGSGRSATLRAVARRLDAHGRVVHPVEPGARPFSGLVGRLGPPPPEAPVAGMVARMRERLRAGEVFVADDPERLDPWTRRVLDEVAGEGAVIRVGPGGLPLAPQPEAALRDLFSGPDRLLHLREDGARELWRRTGGLPARVAEEVTAWVTAGLARLERDGRVRVSRGALDRLAAGLRLDAGGEGIAASLRLEEPLASLVGWVALAWPHASEALLARCMDFEPWQVELMVTELEAGGHLRRRRDGTWEAMGTAASAALAWADDRRREAHARVAALLPPGAEGRLAHLVAAGEVEGLAEEAARLARELTDRGHAARAFGVVETALLAVGGQGGAAAALPELLVELARAAVVDGSEAMLEQCRYRMRAYATGDVAAARALQLVTYMLAARHHPDPTLFVQLGALGAMGDEELEQARQGARFDYVREVDPAGLPALLADLDAWAGEDGGRRAVVRLYRGRLAYYAERYDEAAALQLEAAELAGPGRVGRTARIAAAAAWLEAGQFERAAAVAAQVEAEAVAARLPVAEARAAWVARSVAYRTGRDLEPDLELVAAVEEARLGPNGAQILFTEAAFAWRRRDIDAARRWAGSAAALWGEVSFQAGADLAAALAFLCGAAEPEGGRRLADRLVRARVPGLALQGLGLLAAACPALGVQVAPEVRRLHARVPAARRALRMEVLAPNEALAYCLGEPGG